MVLGNQNAATFLNILVENEQNKIKTIQKQEDTKSQKEDDNHLRLKYDTEDEFLANEKNDGEAAFRIVQKCYNQLKTPATYAGENELYSCIERLDKVIKYCRIAKVYYPLKRGYFGYPRHNRCSFEGAFNMKESFQKWIFRIQEERRRNRFDE